MLETYKYIVIDTVSGLLVGQLLVTLADWKNKAYISILLMMFVGMAIGAMKDKTINEETVGRRRHNEKDI